MPLRWKKNSFPSSAAINPKPRSATNFLMVPVGISISYISRTKGLLNWRACSRNWSLHLSAGASPATDSIPSRSVGYSSGFHGPPGPGLSNLGQVALAQAQVLRGHLEQFVVGQEVQGLLQALPAGRGQAHGDVRGGRADVGLLLLAANIDADVSRPLLDAHDHPLVDLLTGHDERRAPLLRRRQPERESRPRRGG